MQDNHSPQDRPAPSPLERRTLLKGAAVGAALAGSGLAFGARGQDADAVAAAKVHTLPDLPYAADALEPVIGKRIMELHHGKHHAAYVKGLNTALEKYPMLAAQDAETVLRDLDRVPEDVRTAVRNHGGGHANHSMFWQIMGPSAGGAPTGELASALSSTFGDLAQFQEAFNKAGAGQFGSGWVWLTLAKDGKLAVESTPNQDSPLSQGREVIMGNDVWEHAYYLTYENRRPDYLAAWWKVVNWPAVTERYAAAKARLKG
jgi:Fe-Mn family superoxide dismutase